MVVDTLYLYYIKTHRTNISLSTHCAQRIHTHLPVYLLKACESVLTQCVDTVYVMGWLRSVGSIKS